MKKLFLLLLGTALLGSAGAQAKTVYAYKTWEPDTETPDRGIIAFDPADVQHPTMITHQPNDGVIYGGYYFNYHWFAQVTNKGTQSSIQGFYDVDMTTGERRLIAKGGTKLIDMTYDYTTGTVYGVRTGNKILCTLDPATGSVAQVGQFSNQGQEVYMLAIAADIDGTLYGVSPDGNFFRIDPKTAAVTSVGVLNVKPGFDQTMTFDHNDGTLYWFNNGDHTLYTIDKTTCTATELGSVGLDGGASSLGSMFVPYINSPAGAPDRVTAATATGLPAAVELKWTHPTATVRGEKLTAYSGVRIVRDGATIATLPFGTEALGTAASYTDRDVTAGREYTYEIVPFNAAGDGGVDAVKLSAHVGADRPGMVGDFKVTVGDGCAQLSWTAPTAGAANGVFSPADVTGYQVKRGTRLLATLPADQLSYEDQVSYGKYTYSVAAVSNQGTGIEATAENVLVKPASWIIMSDGEAAVDAGTVYTFYDEGGPSGNYGNSSNYTLTLAPSDQNGVVTVEFKSLDIESYDGLSVYQGRGTAGELVGKFSGTSVPAELRHLESTASDGCLTFAFVSDVMENCAGWEASVTAFTLSSCDLAANALNVPSIAVAGEKTSVAVTVSNKGVSTAKGYTVEILDGTNVVASAQGPDIAPRAAAVTTVEFTPAVEGTVTLAARVRLSGDTDESNDVSEPKSLKVLAAGSAFVDIPVEDPATLYVVPVSFMGFESISETILPSALLAPGKDLQLAAITFPFAECTASYDDVPFTLWVGECTGRTLAATTVPASQLTKVFEGNVSIAGGSAELTFYLDKPYTYTGQDLVYMIHKHKSPTDQSGVTFYGEYDYAGHHADCTRFASNWDEEAEPLDPEANFGYGPSNMRPGARLIFSKTGGGVGDVTVVPAHAVALDGRTLTAAEGARIYNGAGMLTAVLEAGEQITLAPGIYVVATPAGSLKIAVR